MKRLIILVVVGIFVCFSLSDAPIRAQEGGNTLHVPDPYLTIQSAINEAVSGDTILVADGTYTGTGNKNLDFGGKDIILKSAAGAANCIIDCELSGRAFYIHSGETEYAILDGFTIRNGNATENGGGICCRKSSPTILNCIIENNSAGTNGGGIYCHSANPTVINCLIVGNSANDNGGGVYCQQADPTLINCTIASNSAGSWGGGLWCRQGDVVVDNTIIWSNSAGAGGYQIRLLQPGTLELSYCDFADGNKDVNAKGELITSHCITDNPLFADAQAGDYHLYPSSPCVNAGDSSLLPAGVTEDIEGTERVLGSNIDMGPYEYLPTIYVNGTTGDDDKDGFSWATAVWTIQRGIDRAIEKGGDGWTVLVADGTYTGTGNKELEFQGFAIHLRSAGGSASCIIDCEQSGRGVNFYNYEAQDTVIKGFTIQNGSADRGGGILCEGNSSPTMTNCIIADCSADTGGGIYCEIGEPAITGCTITGNTANHGAGIYCSWNAEPVVTDCVISNNTVSWGEGGGVYCNSSSFPTIANCDITGNSADRGSGIYCGWNSFPTITDCAITGNGQPDSGWGYYEGGGIFCESDSSLTITNCTISENFAHSGGGILCSSTWFGEGNLIADCTIEDNTANYGAGIYCSWSADPVITNCTIADNEVPWGEGGGIYCNGSSIPIVANCDITGNFAYMNGGGISCSWNSDPTIINCSISNNTSNGYGAGISCDNSNPVITNCIINGNSTTNTGAAINCQNSSPVLTNCIIAGNSAHNGAGFASFGYSQPTVNNCTIAGNSAEYQGGGVYCFDADFTANNTIIWGNSASIASQIWTGYSGAMVVVTLNYCCYPTGGDNGGNIEGSGTVISVNCIHDDPLFVDAQAGDYHLFDTSPCIDAGDNTLIPDGVVTDLDGSPRIMGEAVDIGAYEFPAEIPNTPPNPPAAEDIILRNDYDEAGNPIFNPVIPAPGFIMARATDDDPEDTFQFCQVQVSLSEDFAEEDLLWDSEKVAFPSPVPQSELWPDFFLSYAGDPIPSGATIYVRVKVWDNRGGESTWSETKVVEFEPYDFDYLAARPLRLSNRVVGQSSESKMRQSLDGGKYTRLLIRSAEGEASGRIEELFLAVGDTVFIKDTCMGWGTIPYPEATFVHLIDMHTETELNGELAQVGATVYPPVGPFPTENPETGEVVYCYWFCSKIKYAYHSLEAGTDKVWTTIFFNPGVGYNIPPAGENEAVAVIELTGEIVPTIVAGQPAPERLQTGVVESPAPLAVLGLYWLLAPYFSEEVALFTLMLSVKVEFQDAQGDAITKDKVGLGPNSNTLSVFAEITPSNVAVNFSSTDETKATVTPKSGKGKVALRITGKGESATRWDVGIQAKQKDNVIKTLLISVVKPKTQTHSVLEKTYKHENISVPRPTRRNPNLVALASQVWVHIKLEFKDQFGDTLDHIYNGDYRVYERFSKPKYKKNIRHLLLEIGKWLPVKFPNPTLKDGVKLDRSLVRWGDRGPVFTTKGSQKEKDWKAGKPIVIGQDRSGRDIVTNTLFSILPPVYGSVTLEISVDGIQVTPNFIREAQTSRQDEPDPVPFKVTETPITEKKKKQ